MVKHFHAEPGSVLVTGMVEDPRNKVSISSLGLVELQSAFAVKVRSRTLNEEAARMYQVRLAFAVSAGNIDVYSTGPQHFLVAESLIRRHAFSERLRTLDALQLAVALDLSEQGLIDKFVVCDRVLAGVAFIEGLAVLNPQSTDLSQG